MRKMSSSSFPAGRLTAEAGKNEVSAADVAVVGSGGRHR